MSEHLTELHNQVSKVTPIHGILGQQENGIPEVWYDGEPTPEQKAEVDELLRGWPLAEAQLDQKAELNENVQAIEARGYTTSKGFVIDLSSAGASDLTGAVVLAKEAVENGYEGDHYILDIEGITHAVTYEELIQIGIEYGAARNALYIAASQTTKLIEAAKTPEELEHLALTAVKEA
jgi:hypothetical protein